MLQPWLSCCSPRQKASFLWKPPPLFFFKDPRIGARCQHSLHFACRHLALCCSPWMWGSRLAGAQRFPLLWRRQQLLAGLVGRTAREQGVGAAEGWRETLQNECVRKRASGRGGTAMMSSGARQRGREKQQKVSRGGA